MFRKVILGVSGGVDSAVAGFLLKQRGFDVRGVFLKNWDLVDETGICSGERDWEDAQYVCDKLQIPIQRIDFVKQYWTNVFETMLEEYQKGWTPNPDVYCNKYIKFGVFYKYAKENLAADAIATGHYARTSFGTFLDDFKSNQNVKLLQAVDCRKDQTFFLSQIPQDALRQTMFPTGSMLKSEVKQLAKEIGLEPIAKKRESTGICFIGKRKFSDFMKEYVSQKIGHFVNIETGQICGQHKGIYNYTIGQNARIHGDHRGLYVVRIMADENTILLAPGTDHRALFSDLFYTGQPHWIDRSPFNGNFVARVMFRFQHGHTMKACDLVETQAGLFVKLENPIRAICPGQFAVFYKDNECLGSAKIIANGPYIRDNDESIEPVVEERRAEEAEKNRMRKKIRKKNMTTNEYITKKEGNTINENERIAEKQN